MKQEACGDRDLAVTDSQALQFAPHIHAALLGADGLTPLTSVCGHPAVLTAHADAHLFLDLSSV